MTSCDPVPVSVKEAGNNVGSFAEACFLRTKVHGASALLLEEMMKDAGERELECVGIEWPI